MPATDGDLTHCLAEALGHLVSNRGRQGHWGDVRSTALAVWAFTEVVSPRTTEKDAFPELRSAIDDASKWLMGQARREDGGFSWEAEAWDTSLAVLALGTIEECGERVDQGVAWLHRIRDPKSGVWYDEVWETTLTTVALLRAERWRQRPTHDFTAWLEPVLKWFLRIPSKGSGEFVCPHYSGFLAWILGEIQVTRFESVIQSSETFRSFREKALAGVRFLLEKSEAAAEPWSAYTFSNAYIAYGLSVLSRSETLDTRYRKMFITWMKNRQGSCGGFEDTEDTAIAVAALSALIDTAEERTLGLDKLSRLMPRPPRRIWRCFLGYSSKSNAIAIQIKESLAARVPRIEIIDWRWDFQLGKVLISEIEKVSHECQIAIFLITKDDQIIQSRGASVDSPRDNVVFEVGFFAARLGMDHTLLVVEKGAKIPSDWGGILYIPLRERKNLAEVHLAIIDAIKKVVKL